MPVLNLVIMSCNNRKYITGIVISDKNLIKYKGKNLMKKVDDKHKTEMVISELEKVIKSFKCVGEYQWGNPAGLTPGLDVYEISDGVRKVWLSMIEWLDAGTFEPNRSGIIALIPEINQKGQLSQSFEMTIPYYFSKKFYTRLFEDDDNFEIRNYGKFTIGRTGLKMKYFFDYLKENNYEDEIKYDEDGKEYITILNFKKMTIEPVYLRERLLTCTFLVKEFKDYRRSLI